MDFSNCGPIAVVDDNPKIRLLLEQELTDILGLKTKIRTKGCGGEILFAYHSIDELESLLVRLR